MSATETIATYGKARIILGPDFIQPEEIEAQRPGIFYSEEQMNQLSNTAPSHEVLEWCRDNGYVLIAGPNQPMSLLEIRAIRSDYFYIKKGGWYDEQTFAKKDKAETSWIMLRKEPIPGSTSKKWFDQRALLSDGEVTPNIAEVAWCLTTYKAVRNTYLLPSIYVRTSSLDSDGHRVVVGDFDIKGMLVNSWHKGSRFGDLGLSAAKKLV